MTWTLSTLKTAIQDYSETDETSFVNNLPNFIKTTEERILKAVQLDDFIKNVTGTATSGTAYLGAPSDYLSSFSLAVIDSSSNYNYLKLKHASFIRDFTPASSTTGLPKYYAEFDEDTFILAPTPDSNYTFELHYFFRPSSLTSAGDSGSTWLSDNAPNAMLYGSLVEAMVYLKNYESLPIYEQRFQEAIGLLKNLGEGKSTQDQYRYDEVRRTPQS
tara:strand:- start:1531 stop:2181 length:651 start_codon:yes stop_codon:yes gene_type:complete